MNNNNSEKNTKTLFLLRHGKSSWEDTGINDHERSLNKRGLKDAPKMGKLLRKLKVIPDLIISSSAKRAVDTATYVSEYCGYNKKIEINELLYFTSPQDYLNVISEVSNVNKVILIVGHNPILEQLLEKLTNKIETLPTCALVQLNINIPDWKLLASESRVDASIVNIWRPKTLEL